MSDFLSNLIARGFTDAPVIQPRVPSLFETATDEFFDGPQSSTAPGAEPETVGRSRALASKLSPIRETATTNPITNVSAVRAEKRTPKSDDSGDQRASTIAQPSQPNVHAAKVKKIEVETKKLELERDEVIAPVDSLRAREKEGDNKTGVAEVFPDRGRIQFRRRKDLSAIEQRSSTSAPVIRVTIGRVEVRAIHPTAPAPKPAKATPQKLSLEDYLHKREGGVR
jgi:hypothetical protein